MGLLNLKPARTQHTESVDPIIDLDALIAEPVAFRWQGKTHLVRPMDTKTFFKITNEMSRIQSMIGKDHSNEQVVEAYARVFGTVCDTITKRDVYNMTQAQVGALFQMIMDCVSGRAQKKTPQTVTPTQAG